MPTRLTGADRGETITVPELDYFTPTMVLSRCTLASVGYYCASCRLHLANIGNLVMHLEDHPEQPHHVAVWCGGHRVYEAMPAEQVAALGGDSGVAS